MFFGSKQMERSSDLLGCYGPCFDLVMSKHGTLRTLIYDAIYAMISSPVLAFCLSLIHWDIVIVHDVFQRMHQQNHVFQGRTPVFRDATNLYYNLYMLVLTYIVIAIYIYIYSSISIIWYQIQFEYLISFFTHLLPLVSWSDAAGHLIPAWMSTTSFSLYTPENEHMVHLKITPLTKGSNHLNQNLSMTWGQTGPWFAY